MLFAAPRVTRRKFVSFDQIFVLAVLLGALVLFATEVIPLGVTGLCVVAVLGLGGILEPTTALSALASPTVVIVGSLYIVSAALVRTGVVGRVGERLLELGGSSETLFFAMVGSLLLSTLLNNTAVVVLMLPILLGAAHKMDIPPSRLLMPVSFAAILGGTMTLIGTSTNVLVADLAAVEASWLEPIGFFEFLPVGAGYAILGMLYLGTIGRRLLPSRPTVSSITKGLTFEYVTELRVPEGSPASSMTRDTLLRRAGDGVRLLQHIRGEEILPPGSKIEAGDCIVLRGPAGAVVMLRRDLRLEAPTGEEVGGRGTTFAELVITPGSELLGRTLEHLGLKRKFGVIALAIQRLGAHLRSGIANLPLRLGDVVLVQGTPREVERLRGERGFLLLTGVEEQVVRRRHAPIALGILVTFVAMAALSGLYLPLLALASAVATMVTGCISLRRAMSGVDWSTLGLLAGSICLGSALHTTHLATEVASVVVSITHRFGDVAVLSAVYFLTMVVTEFVSNSGAAALMLPISLSTAATLGVNERAFIFAVAFGASASFSTPIGYQTNAFIFGPGGYRFRDFVRVGLPLQLLLWIYATIALPIAFPLRP